MILVITKLLLLSSFPFYRFFLLHPKYIKHLVVFLARSISLSISVIPGLINLFFLSTLFSVLSVLLLTMYLFQKKICPAVQMLCQSSSIKYQTRSQINLRKKCVDQTISLVRGQSQIIFVLLTGIMNLRGGICVYV